MSATKIQIRRDIASIWGSVNPVLSAGEMGLDLSSMKFKIGDGASTWNELEYYAPKKVSGGSQPVSPQHGDLWINTTVCPPELKVYNDGNVCSGSSSGWV